MEKAFKAIDSNSVLNAGSKSKQIWPLVVQFSLECLLGYQDKQHWFHTLCLTHVCLGCPIVICFLKDDIRRMNASKNAPGIPAGHFKMSAPLIQCSKWCVKCVFVRLYFFFFFVLFCSIAEPTKTFREGLRCVSVRREINVHYVRSGLVWALFVTWT